jgi:hypothetical protein
MFSHSASSQVTSSSHTWSVSREPSARQWDSGRRGGRQSQLTFYHSVPANCRSGLDISRPQGAKPPRPSHPSSPALNSARSPTRTCVRHEILHRHCSYLGYPTRSTVRSLSSLASRYPWTGERSSPRSMWGARLHGQKWHGGWRGGRRRGTRGGRTLLYIIGILIIGNLSLYHLLWAHLFVVNRLPFSP